MGGWPSAKCWMYCCLNALLIEHVVGWTMCKTLSFCSQILSLSPCNYIMLVWKTHQALLKLTVFIYRRAWEYMEMLVMPPSPFLLLRFPLELTSSLTLLHPLTSDPLSTHYLFQHLSNVSYFTELFSPRALGACVDLGEEEGTWVLTHPRTLYAEGRWSLRVVLCG